MTTPITVSSNVYRAIDRAIRNDGAIKDKELTKITKEIEKDGITADEQKLLDGFKSPESNVMTVRFSDKEPVLEISTFPEKTLESIPERMFFGGIDSAPYDTALRNTKVEILKGNSTKALDWMDATDFNQVLTDLKPRELEKLLKEATKVTEYTVGDFPGSHLMNTLAQHLDARGAAQLQQKLSPASLELLKVNMAKLEPEQQEKLKALGF